MRWEIKKNIQPHTHIWQKEYVYIIEFSGVNCEFWGKLHIHGFRSMHACVFELVQNYKINQCSSVTQFVTFERDKEGERQQSVSSNFFIFGLLVGWLAHVSFYYVFLGFCLFFFFRPFLPIFFVHFFGMVLLARLFQHIHTTRYNIRFFVNTLTNFRV